MARIMVVDDEPKLSKLISEMLELAGHEVVRASGGRAALVELAARPLDLVITDLRMPEVDGLSVLREARARPDPPEVVMITAHGSTESAVEAMKQGAADYLLKPFALEELHIRVRRLTEQRATGMRNRNLVERLTPALIAESGRMKAALESARRVASTDTTVLLLGESGTGKSQLARFVHFASSRAQGPLIEVHCAALPEALLEAELFGHEKGAFTGAHEKREGHLAAAHRGSLFLDVIGEITPATQVKLLRFLQDKEFVPVGSTQPRKVDVRVIAATNRDLATAVREGQFREDFTTGSTSSPLRSRRCASEARTSSHWRKRSCACAACQARGLARARATAYGNAIGPGTCESWRIRSSARSFSRGMNPSPPSTSTRPETRPAPPEPPTFSYRASVSTSSSAI